jgi:hypothetical protein
VAHRDLHPEYKEGCMGCKVLSLNVGAGALETKGVEVRATDAREKKLSKDLDAYQRLRDNGLQPRNIDGSSDLESKVNSQWDIDLGRIIPKSEESRVREGFAMVAEGGLG